MGLFSSREPRKTPQEIIAANSPAMKVVLGQDPRFEWRPVKESYGDRSDMQLVTRNEGHHISTAEALSIFDALKTLGVKEPFFRPHDGEIPKGKMKIFALQDDLAFGSHEPGGLSAISHFRNTEASEVLAFGVSVSAETYRELIAPQIAQKHGAVRTA